MKKNNEKRIRYGNNNISSSHFSFPLSTKTGWTSQLIHGQIEEWRKKPGLRIRILPSNLDKGILFRLFEFESEIRRLFLLSKKKYKTAIYLFCFDPDAEGRYGQYWIRREEPDRYMDPDLEGRPGKIHGSGYKTAIYLFCFDPDAEGRYGQY